MRIIIGCDPEFVLARNDYFVPANEVFSTCLDNALGCDGASETGELRPGCSDNVIELAERILSTLSYINEVEKGIKVYAGHFKFNKPLGGHIHFSFINKKLTEKEIYEFADYLDFYLIDCLSDLIDDLDEREARRNFGYGLKLAESKDSIRLKSNSHFEYRSPGSWLICPKVAITNLVVAKNVIYQKIHYGIKEKGVCLNDDSERRKKIMGLWDVKEKVPEDCWEMGKIVEEVINSKIDWNVNIKEEWL